MSFKYMAMMIDKNLWVALGLLIAFIVVYFIAHKTAEGFDGTNRPKNASSSSSTDASSSTDTSSSSSFDNYNHYSGTSSQLANGSMYYGPNGGTIVVATNADGSQSLQITLKTGESPVTYSNESNESSGSSESSGSEGYTNVNKNIFIGPNGATATVVTANGQTGIHVTTSYGTTLFTPTNPNAPNITSTQYYGSTGTPITEYNPPGYNPPGTNVYNNNPPGYNPPGTGVYNPPGYNPPGTNVYNNNPPGYNPPGTGGSLGIPSNQIPPGQEDLYILKSQVVPPVCPACPPTIACPASKTKIPACPACARCPEPSFDCKKVPNYNAMNNSYLPTPVLNDFSSFGM